ncbi:hypothetical protein PENTCL1PPCAC_9040 [Pristionchus entomophagus]|uniref:Uncharacterized protein n=1 Tax=Pristionchus entomophagus TaxID=358040 RepID=A0AAV5T3E7_9BILA|nr:hypothetical protein PENTCL1PPCAC_9040 [Pristionchus entomophagus]
MKGLGISVPPLHAGVRFDLEALLAAFKAKNSVRFEAFGECFAALKMSLIFAGRQSAAELIEFEEHLLQLSAAWMMSLKSGEIAGYPERFDSDAKPAVPIYARADRPPENLPAAVLKEAKKDEMEEEEEMGGGAVAVNHNYVMTLVERMFGIYATYAFYYLQPTDYAAQIRVSPAQMRDIVDFLDERLRPERHLDAMGCLYKLFNEGAFRITAFELTYDPACHKRYEAEDEDECCLPPGSDRPLERLTGLAEDRTMEQIELLHKRYEEAKQEAGFKGISHGKIDVKDSIMRLIDYAKVHIQMEESRPILEAGRAASASSAAAAAAAAALAGETSRLDIKQRAYASGVTASRHRRYAFVDGEETVNTGAETDEEPQPSSSKKGPPKKKGRPSRKSQREEKADELIQEMHELGVPGVVRRKNQSPRKSISENPDAILNEFLGGKRKRINKSEAKNLDPLIRVTKSKVEESADRELAKIMKQMQKEGGA